jgi:hypothetical protein
MRRGLLFAKMLLLTAITYAFAWERVRSANSQRFAVISLENAIPGPSRLASVSEPRRRAPPQRLDVEGLGRRCFGSRTAWLAGSEWTIGATVVRMASAPAGASSGRTVDLQAAGARWTPSPRLMGGGASAAPDAVAETVDSESRCHPDPAATCGFWFSIFPGGLEGCAFASAFEHRGGVDVVIAAGVR